MTIMITVICFLIKNKSDEIFNFSTQFCLGSIYKCFTYVESKEVSYIGKVYGFSADSNGINTPEFLTFTSI